MFSRLPFSETIAAFIQLCLRMNVFDAAVFVASIAYDSEIFKLMVWSSHLCSLHQCSSWGVLLAQEACADAQFCAVFSQRLYLILHSDIDMSITQLFLSLFVSL